MQMDEGEKLRKMETLRFQIDEIEKAKLTPGEDEQLENRRKILQNAEKLSDGINGNNPGKQNPLDMENEGKENSPYGLIIDDYINVQAGEADVNGPASEVTLMLFGTFAVTNPSNCGHGLFYGANTVSLSA
jgi:hypothetical protein